MQPSSTECWFAADMGIFCMSNDLFDRILLLAPQAQRLVTFPNAIRRESLRLFLVEGFEPGALSVDNALLLSHRVAAQAAALAETLRCTVALSRAVERGPEILRFWGARLSQIRS